MVGKAFHLGSRRGTSRVMLSLLPIGNFFYDFVKVFMKMDYQELLRSEGAREFRSNNPITEDNWKSRQNFCSNLADAIDKYGKKDLPSNFMDVIEPYLNNMLDCAVSERTTLAIQACRAVGNLPKVLGKDIHPFLDRILPALIRHCASTKAVNQKSAAAAMSSVIAHSTYNNRLLWHVCQAFQDKYSGPKLYAPGWLKLILQEYSKSLHPDRDYDTVAHAIAIGLEEADNNVRVNSRAVFWEYHRVDPAGADEIIAKLNNHARNALLNDPNNPDKKSANTKPKPKAKKPAEVDSTLAQIRQEAKARMKQGTSGRNIVPNSNTGASQDLPRGSLDKDDDRPVSSSNSKTSVNAPPSDSHTTMHKTATRPPAGHKKGFSHGSEAPQVTKKASAMDINVPKKQGSVDSLRTSQNKKTTSAPVVDAANSRPLLSAPVRRPRIVATPMNSSQSSSRPSSRTGAAQPAAVTGDLPLRSAASHRELKSNLTEIFAPESQTAPAKTSKKIPRSELSSPVLIPDGKENAILYPNQKNIQFNEPQASPAKAVPTIERKSPTKPQQITKIPSDGLTTQHRVHRQEVDRALQDMAVAMPEQHQFQDQQHPLMDRVYPTLNHDGEVHNARRALTKAIDYLQKDALDYLGFRKLRKMLEQFGRNLIIDQSLYDILFSELLQRLGSFEELIAPPNEAKNESHPRYIRQAVLTMINILVHDYPFEWSYQYQGPALASIMIARCCYSPNTDFHDGAPYRHSMSIVDQINRSTLTIIESSLNPVEVLDSILPVLAAGEDFLMRCAPHESESQKSWASFNPYSKINRLRTEKSAFFHPVPTNLEDFSNVDPKPLPMRLPLLMETAIKIIQALIYKAAMEDFKLGEEREDVLADLARHLMSSYNIIIRKQVMEYCQVLYKNFESEARFWTHFPDDSERNLLHYYLEKVR